ARPSRRLRAVRRAIRLRRDVPQVRPREMPGRKRPTRAEKADPARAVRRVKWLTADGLAAALAVGTATTWGLGVGGLGLLVTFFVTGSLVTQISGGAGGQRNARQVIANGGAAAVA